MAKEFKLTRERLKELEEELNYLKTTRGSPLLRRPFREQ